MGKQPKSDPARSGHTGAPRTQLSDLLRVPPGVAERLDRPDKIWKYNPGDVVERAKWPAYVEAYTEALTRCNTDAAPWHIVPSGRKWYRNWAVAQLLWEHLERLDPQWPKANVDVAVEKQRLAAT